jgi:hypothetical protein
MEPPPGSTTAQVTDTFAVPVTVEVKEAGLPGETWMDVGATLTVMFFAAGPAFVEPPSHARKAIPAAAARMKR